MKLAVFCTIPLLAGACMLPFSAGCADRVGIYTAAPAGYDYYYYPDSEVYFYPSASIYFWHDHDHDRWVQGRELPRQYRVDDRNRVSLHLHTDRPYTVHDQVRAEHPWHADNR
jgi:hypothetical protein